MKAHRTAIANQIRGIGAEYGVVFNVGIRSLPKQLPDALEDASNDLTIIARTMLQDLLEQLTLLSKKIAAIDNQISDLASQNKLCQSLMTISGYGPIVSTAIVSAIGNGRQFKNGRQFAAWLGLTPKQNSSGDRQRLQGITKNGSKPLRCTVIQGARTVMNWCDNNSAPVSQWVKQVKKWRGGHRAAVTLANKCARIAWAVMNSEQAFDARKVSN